MAILIYCLDESLPNYSKILHWPCDQLQNLLAVQAPHILWPSTCLSSCQDCWEGPELSSYCLEATGYPAWDTVVLSAPTRRCRRPQKHCLVWGRKDLAWPSEGSYKWAPEKRAMTGSYCWKTADIGLVHVHDIKNSIYNIKNRNVKCVKHLHALHSRPCKDEGLCSRLDTKLVSSSGLETHFS